MKIGPSPSKGPWLCAGLSSEPHTPILGHPHGHAAHADEGTHPAFRNGHSSPLTRPRVKIPFKRQFYEGRQKVILLCFVCCTVVFCFFPSSFWHTRRNNWLCHVGCADPYLSGRFKRGCVTSAWHNTRDTTHGQVAVDGRSLAARVQYGHRIIL